MMMFIDKNLEQKKSIMNPWSKDSKFIIDELESSSENGLSQVDAEIRLEKYSQNILVQDKKISFFNVFKHEVTEAMILLLIGVGILYSIFGNISDAITIFSIITVLVFVEIYNEYRAKKTIASLKELAAPLTSVIRDGKIVDIDPKLLVPGDIILLKVGQKLPADMRIIESYGLQINESILTGESIPVMKESDVVLSEMTELMERKNMAFAGTTITRGKGKGLITSTSMDTEIGKIAGLTKVIKEPKTPLQLAMKQLSSYLVFVALFFCILIPLVGIFQGRNIIDMLLTGLSLSFATIPEELPIIIMIVLALGAYTLTKQKGLVKNLNTAETLGSVTVIATDKTGTITENKMKLSKIYSNGAVLDINDKPLPMDHRVLLEVGILLNDVIIKNEETRISYIGDPMEVAIIETANKNGIKSKDLKKTYSLKDECTFDNQRMLMSQLYEKDNDYILYLKGAAEAVLDRSNSYTANSSIKTLSPKIIKEILKIIDTFANEGLRVIAFAYKKLNQIEACNEKIESDLIFLGLMAFLDPPRIEVKNAIAKTKKAGVRIIMVTGDYDRTAKAIAAEVGIGVGISITGSEIELISDSKLQETVKNTDIFARATPEHKLRIIKALKFNGERVAVTGDGINDAPALKMADIGIAMGATGTDVARESADMILLDDNFATITLAIEQGRKLYDNLKKGVKYYLAVKLALIIIFLLPILFSIPLPFTPIQIILLELFMDLAASATFVIEPNESDVMKKKPRDPNEKFINIKMISILLLGGISLCSAVLIIYFFTYSQGIERAQTLAFGTWMIGHIFLALNMRTEKDPLFKVGFLSNKMMVFWGILVMLTLLFIIYIPPLQVVFNTTSINLIDFIFIILTSFICTFWIEIVKIIFYKTNK